MNKPFFLFITLLFIVIVCNTIYAQPNTGQSIHASAGLGFSYPDYETDYESDDENNIEASGFYAQAEYVYAPVSWFGIRPYVGLIVASGTSENNETEQYRLKSNAVLLGVKIRLAAPIPYVAPFIESGIGASIGSFETVTDYASLRKNGVIPHIPFSFGLAVGRNHNYEIKFTYYYQSSVDQFVGAAAFGITFPIDE